MSCAATRQGDEMYCSRCQIRWAAAEPKTVVCLPNERRTAPRKVATLTGDFEPRAFVLQRRGWIRSPGVLERMEVIAREAYALGKKAGAKQDV